MALTFLQIIKDEKSFKAMNLEKLPSQNKFCASSSPETTEIEQSLGSCSTKGMEVCSSVVLSDYTCTHVMGYSPTASKLG